MVVPTYRRADMLAEALASIAAQRRPADEVIVVSDGPNSDARDAAQRFGAHFIELSHGGVARARNAGIAAATGDWVCFLDDDDLYHPDFLAEITRYLAKDSSAEALNTWYWRFSATPTTGADLVVSNVADLVASADRTTPRSSMEYLQITGNSFDFLLSGLRGNLSSSAVLRTRLLEAGCFPEGVVCAEDWTMFLNVARYTEWHVIERRLVFMRMHQGNNTSSRAVLNSVHTLKAFGDAWHDDSRPTPDHRPLDAYRLDYRFMLIGALRAARQHHDWDSYRELLQLSRRLLPRSSDQLRAIIRSSLPS